MKDMDKKKIEKKNELLRDYTRLSEAIAKTSMLSNTLVEVRAGMSEFLSDEIREEISDVQTTLMNLMDELLTARGTYSKKLIEE